MPSPVAALINGASAHSFDFDDYDEASQAHASAVLVPAILAFAEEIGSSGAEALDAYIIGLEVIIRIGEAVNMAHYNKGWHTTATLGIFGAAAACARLYGADAGEMLAALSIAASYSAGMKVQFGTDAKPLHAGIAAQNGVTAATLARAGLSGHKDALDGPLGFVSLYAGSDAPDFPTGIPKLGNPLAIEEFGLIIKRFPNCACLHRALDCFFELKDQHGLTADMIESVVANVPHAYAESIKYTAPDTPAEARFSMQYGISVAMLQDRVSLADYTPDAVARPEVRALYDKVSFKTFSTGASPGVSATQPPEGVGVTTTTGARLTSESAIVVGDPRLPLSPDQLDAKFADCVLTCFDTDKTGAILTAVADLDKLQQVGVLSEMLRP